MALKIRWNDPRAFYIKTENNTTISDGKLPVRMGLKVEVNSHGIKLGRSLRTNVIFWTIV